MTKRRLTRWSLILVALAVFAVWLEPTRVVWGWLRGEAFYQGRPTSYWSHEIENWEILSEAEVDSDEILPIVIRREGDPSRLRIWFTKSVLGKRVRYGGYDVRVKFDEVEPVLLELIQDSTSQVRTQAILIRAALLDEKRRAAQQAVVAD